MRTLVSLLLAGALVAGAGAAQAADRSPAAQLARATAGRVAGTPVSCIDLSAIRSTRIIDRTAIVYELTGNRIYVNRPAAGAELLRDGLALITDTHTSQLCNVDIVRLYDTGARMPSGTIGLGEFVPYTKAAPAGGS